MRFRPAFDQQRRRVGVQGHIRLVRGAAVQVFFFVCITLYLLEPLTRSLISTWPASSPELEAPAASRDGG